MMTKNIDWANLGFGYIKTDYRYVSNYKDGSWDEGTLSTDETITLNESAGVLQYAQTCFEGMKAYRTVDNKVVCFRPDMNAKRMADTCKRLEMPVLPEEKFIDAVIQTVKANIDWVPPYGTGAALYLRPYMFAYNAVIGVKPATEFQFRIFATPVGAYFKGGTTGVALRVPDFDRAAPRGTGHVKAGLNYAMSLHPVVEAHKQGYAENLYLDSATRTNVEETGGANVIFVTKDNTVVTPKSNTILPSITRRSLMYVAEKYLGLKTEERVIPYSEVKEFKECALCGTAAVLSPVGRIDNNGESIHFDYNSQGIGEVTKKLYDTLVGIQLGKIEAPEGWIRVVE
ncbi:branched-chain amino acid aminotransferase [bacterium]|nr:branched-chain amino acid aminotransferase [bacterium]